MDIDLWILLLLLPRGNSWHTVWKIDLCCLTVLFFFYTGNTNWSLDTGKALIQPIGPMCMTETWVKHDWESAVDEAADFTGCACNTREGIVSPTWESLRGEAIFTWIPCRGMQCGAVGRSHSKQLQVPHSLTSSSLSLSPPVQPSYGKRAEHVEQDWAGLTSSFFSPLLRWQEVCSLMQLVLTV